jgi:hypothetical protein
MLNKWNFLVIFNRQLIGQTMQILLYTIFLILVSGCSFNGKLIQNESINLISPSNNNSIIYFLRIPRDFGDLILYLNDQRIAKITHESFTAVSLPPGDYTIIAIDKNKKQSNPFKIVLLPAQRRFFYTSIPSNDTITDSYIAYGNSLSVIRSTKGYIENRQWKEMSESDAKGLMSILKPIEAESKSP